MPSHAPGATSEAAMTHADAAIPTDLCPRHVTAQLCAPPRCLLARLWPSASEEPAAATSPAPVYGARRQSTWRLK